MYYNEDPSVLEWARKNWMEASDVEKKHWEFVFPELRESEDERIRKFLIGLLSSGTWKRDWPFSPVECVAWLEKQKENPKTVDSIPSFCISDVKWADTIITRAIVALSDDVDYNRDEPCKYRREIDDLKKLRDVLCGLKEQKSAEIDEYKIIKKHITEDSLSSEVNKRLKECGWYVTDEKPAEWSGEDEQYLLVCKNALNKYQRSDHWNANIISNWLERRLKSSLRPVEQEWSEEEKLLIHDAIDWLKIMRDRYALTDEASKDISRIIDALKSLRPQPKQKRRLGMKDQWCCSAAWAAVRDSDAYNAEEKQFILDFLQRCESQPHWKPLPEQLEALMYAIEGKWDMIKPTSYLSRRLEDLYDGLVNTYNVDENSEYIYPEDKK